MITLDQGGAVRDDVRFLPVPSHLDDVVEHIWVVGPSESDGGWRIVPDASAHLLWYADENGHMSVRVVGPRTRFVDLGPHRRRGSGGFRLHPGALSRVLDIPTWEVRDTSLAAQKAWGEGGREVVEKVQGLEGDGVRITRVLSTLLRPTRELQWRARGLLDQVRRGRRARLTQIAGYMGVGERSLRTASRASLGLRPKELDRLLRLHRALSLTLDGCRATAAAVRAGFSDQAHLIRESMTLLGETPTRFRLRGMMPRSSRMPGTLPDTAAGQIRSEEL